MKASRARWSGIAGWQTSGRQRSGRQQCGIGVITLGSERSRLPVGHAVRTNQERPQAGRSRPTSIIAIWNQQRVQNHVGGIRSPTAVASEGCVSGGNVAARGSGMLSATKNRSRGVNGDAKPTPVACPVEPTACSNQRGNRGEPQSPCVRRVAERRNVGRTNVEPVW